MSKDNIHVHISSKHNPFDLKLDEVWQYRDLILLFTKRSFTVSYKQTILGPLWLFINPLITSIIYVILFGNIAKLGTDGIPMLLFYLSGNALWSYFNSCLTNNAYTFTGNVHLFGKVYFHRLTIPISNILTAMIRFFYSNDTGRGINVLLHYQRRYPRIHFTNLSDSFYLDLVRNSRIGIWDHRLFHDNKISRSIGSCRFWNAVMDVCYPGGLSS